MAQSNAAQAVANIFRTPELKEKIYFTQGHGELGIEPGQDSSRTAADVVRYLRDRKVTVEALDLSAPDAKVPNDASVIVVAGPDFEAAVTGPNPVQ